MKFLTGFNQLARMAAQRTDIVIVALMLVAVAMMIIPLPTVMVDLLIGINFAFAILILVVAFYITSPVEFSSLPSVILLSTLFRLSLSITTTRLILTQADAGQIVMAFGDFVVGGEIVVGLVIFLIITIAQFVVITKGAERVAEVGARFALDAMPGKQMSIDNEIRSGEIDPVQAKQLRQNLERESQFYGAMDGAMKFVKGDAIAGLIIIVINLIGGLFIGTLRHGMPFGEAAQTYSLLTVGDGLIAQIPALMTAIAAGTVVTRVRTDKGADLGSEIIGQLAANSRALALAAAILFGCGLVPGFPLVIFWSLALAVAAIAYVTHRKQSARAPMMERPLKSIGDITSSENVSGKAIGGGAESNIDDEQLFALPSPQRLVLGLSETLAAVLSDGSLQTDIVHMRGQVFREIGIRIPVIAVKTDPALESSKFSLLLDGVPLFDGQTWPGQVQVLADHTSLALMGIPITQRPSRIERREEIWVDAGQADSLLEAGLVFHDSQSFILKSLDQLLRRYLSDFVDTHEVRHLLAQGNGEIEELAKEALAVVPLQKLADIIKRLVDENIPVTNMRAILRAMQEWGGPVQSPAQLAEYARLALARQICHRHAETNRVIPAYLFTRSLEDSLRRAIPQGGNGHLPEAFAKPLVEQIRSKARLSDPDFIATIIVPSDLRRTIRSLMVRNDINLAVLAYEEITPEFSVQSLGYIAPAEFTSARQVTSNRESENA